MHFRFAYIYLTIPLLSADLTSTTSIQSEHQLPLAQGSFVSIVFYAFVWLFLPIVVLKILPLLTIGRDNDYPPVLPVSPLSTQGPYFFVTIDCTLKLSRTIWWQLLWPACFFSMHKHITDDGCPSAAAIHRPPAKHRHQMQHPQGYRFWVFNISYVHGPFSLNKWPHYSYFVVNAFFFLRFIQFLQPQISDLHVMQLLDHDGHTKVYINFF